MAELSLGQKLAFLVDRKGGDETVLLAEAMQEGVGVLYREALLEDYLSGQISREEMLQEWGPEELEEIEYQRQALEQDVAWGLRHG
jgi:hypothetical protein